jgi:hypothetical protein
MAYAKLKVTYQRALRRAKRATRDNLRSSKPDGKELFEALKVLSGKSACVSFPQTLSVDGYEACYPKNCAKHFFLADSPPHQTHHIRQLGRNGNSRPM